MASLVSNSVLAQKPQKSTELRFKLVTKPADKLTPTELNTCYKLVRNIRAMYARTAEGWSQQRKIDEMKNTPNLQYLLYYEGSTVVAFASFVVHDELYGLTEPITYLWEIHVHPRLRRHGLGKRLIQKVVQRAEQCNEPLVLRCFTSNRRAQAFYEKTGFRPLDIECDEYSQYLERPSTRSSKESPPDDEQND